MIGLLKGLQATISHLFTKKVTVQYPEQRRQLPERSRGLIRMRLKPESEESRCDSCTFCEQICPAVAIKVVYENKQPGKVWTLDAGAGPMLACFNRGEDALGLEKWPEAEGGVPADVRDGCLAGSLLDAGELTSRALSRTAGKNGVWLSQVFGIATFYDQLGPGAVEVEPAPEMPEVRSPAGDFKPVLLANIESIDPENINSYMAVGGYSGLTRAVTGMSPEAVAEEVAASGLRGRGGSGYPTGAKWQSVLGQEAPQKYVIGNGHEGDPGSFKDRFLLERNPHAVIEGMIIAGYAVGAGEGIIYISAENGLAIERVRQAIEAADAEGFLSQDNSGGGPFSLRVVAAPRAFIGGEESALIATLAGQRPMPRVRPLYPAESGFNRKPTLVDNVETLATVPWILSNGAQAFRETGHIQAPGTKLYALSGAVRKPGIYEATLDITVKKLVEELAGGFTGKARGALVGSVTGGFLPPGLFDIPLDYDSMAEAGGNLSSGAITVLGENNCIADIARQCLSFTAAEACGKCVPGRVGTWRLLGIVEKICSGGADMADLELALDLAADVGDGALCFLGGGAVKPLVTGLKFFRHEFEEHVTDRRCAAGRCSLS